MRSSTYPQRRINVRALMTFFQYGAAAFALSAAQIGGQYAPWALGLLAAAGTGHPGFGALTGAALGGFCFFDFQPGLRYVAEALLIFCACGTFSDTKAYRRPLFRALGAAVLFFMVQFVYFYGRKFSVWLLGLAAAISVAVSCLLLQRLIYRYTPRRVQVQESPPESVQRSAAAFQSLYDSLFRSPAATAPENPAVIFDEAAQKTCRRMRRQLFEELWSSTAQHAGLSL